MLKYLIHILIVSMLVHCASAEQQVAPAERQTESVSPGAEATTRQAPAVDLESDFSQGPDDGRFTLGVRGQRIMYGYPIPTSTSHFVVKVGESYATNAPHLGIRQITSSNRRVQKYGVQVTEMDFRFHGVQITQRLVPLSKGLAPEANPDLVQYYRIEYDFVNQHTEPQMVGLQLLLDTMIDDNDAAPMQVGQFMLRNEKVLAGRQVPARVLVYRTAGNTSDLTGEIITREGGATGPDSMKIGRWPYFHGQIWDFPAFPARYGDSAVVIRWNPAELQPESSRRVATIYGLQARTRPGLALRYNSNLEQKRLTVYFDRNSGRLTPESMEAIQQFVQGAGLNRIMGVIAEGSADYPGSVRTNVWMARQRVDSVRAALVQVGIQESQIIPKVLGESGASQVPAVAPAETELPVDLQTILKEEAARRKMTPQQLMRKIIEDRFQSVYGIREWGDPDDRKVDIILHLREERNEE